MRGVWIGLGLALSSAVAAAQVDQTPAAAPAGAGAGALPTPGVAASPAAESSDTEVQGELPASFAGTWLMIQSPKAKDRYQNVWTIYRIWHEKGAWGTRQIEGAAAPELAAAIKQANSAGTRLQVDKDLLKVVKAMLPTLKAPPQEQRNKKYIFMSRDHFPAEQREGPQLKDAKFSLSIITGGAAIAGGGTNYFIREVQPDSISGGFEAGFVAVPPGLPPVPIGLSGDFVMYRIN